jgi:hypothetical protein
MYSLKGVSRFSLDTSTLQFFKLDQLLISIANIFTTTYTKRASQREHQTSKKGWDQNQYRFVQAILQVTFFIIYFSSLI